MRVIPLILALALASACACATMPKVQHPARPVIPRDAASIAKQRPPLAVPNLVLVHEVAIKTPDRSEVLVGTMTFPKERAFRLEGATPFGYSLFQLAYDGRTFTASVAEPLRDKLPALGIARDIARIYFAACGPDAEVETADEGYELRCTLDDGLRVTELLDPSMLTVTHRTLIDPNGHEAEVRYEDYRPKDGLLHPEHITLTSGALEVRIALSDLRREP